MKYLTIPTPAQIKAARIEAGLTQPECARMVWVTINCWQKWESGERPANMACWQLFNIKLAAK
jgi:DNA-binding transcriptional regulator YiaG